jgi:hypothetical protein
LTSVWKPRVSLVLLVSWVVAVIENPLKNGMYRSDMGPENPFSRGGE